MSNSINNLVFSFSSCVKDSPRCSFFRYSPLTSLRSSSRKGLRLVVPVGPSALAAAWPSTSSRSPICQLNVPTAAPSVTMRKYYSKRNSRYAKQQVQIQVELKPGLLEARINLCRKQEARALHHLQIIFQISGGSAVQLLDMSLMSLLAVPRRGASISPLNLATRRPWCWHHVDYVRVLVHTVPCSEFFGATLFHQ